jgi:hypothetical protein
MFGEENAKFFRLCDEFAISFLNKLYTVYAGIDAILKVSHQEFSSLLFMGSEYNFPSEI